MLQLVRCWISGHVVMSWWLWRSCIGSQSHSESTTVHKSSCGQVLDFWTNDHVMHGSKQELRLCPHQPLFGDRAFSVVAAKAWNSQTPDLKTTDVFKHHLKTWLFKRAYDWHSDHYYYNNYISVFIIIIIVIVIIILCYCRRSLHVL